MTERENHPKDHWTLRNLLDSSQPLMLTIEEPLRWEPTAPSKSNCLYLIGSLRNPKIPELANRLRKQLPNVEVFDEWYSAGPEADDCWKEHQRTKGLSYQEALDGHAARNVFRFDKTHLDRSTHALLVLPAGKSGHMEVMYACYGVGAKTAILLDEGDVRWDVMYQFIPSVLNNEDEIKEWFYG